MVFKIILNSIVVALIITSFAWGQTELAYFDADQLPEFSSSLPEDVEITLDTQEKILRKRFIENSV